MRNRLGPALNLFLPPASIQYLLILAKISAVLSPPWLLDHLRLKFNANLPEEIVWHFTTGKNKHVVVP